jgi:hypothetical protein
MPRKPSSTGKSSPNPYTGLYNAIRNEWFFAHLFSPLTIRLLTTPDEREAIRRLRHLRTVIRTSPTTRQLLSLASARGRGRLKGSVDTSLSEEGVTLAMAVDWVGLKQAEILRMLNRSADSNSHEYQWFRTRLKKGRDSFAKLMEEDPRLKEFRDAILPTLKDSEVHADTEEILRPIRMPD